MNPRATFVLAALVAMAGAMAAHAQVDTLTILHLNDTHSCLAPVGPRTTTLQGTRGGIARAATLIGESRMTDPNVVLLHAGDLFIGDLFFNSYFGVPELRILQALACDAMTVGNHEFDLTPSTLEAALDTAFIGGGFPLLSANVNLDDPGVQGLREYILPFTVKQAGNVTVGIFGLTTPSTNLLSSPAPAFVDTSILPIAAAMVDSLTARGCDIIICLSHLGLALDLALAAVVPGIDAVIGGHDHYLLEAPQAIAHGPDDTTWVVQANAFYMNLGKITFTIEGQSVHLLGYQAIPITSAVPEEPVIAATVETLIAGIEATYGPLYTQQIGVVSDLFSEVAESLAVPGWKDTPIGNLVTDAYRAATGTDVAIQAGGSTAQPLYPGPIVAADVFRVVGYGFNTDNGLGFRMATFNIEGAGLAAGLEIGVSDLSADEFLIQVSGMAYAYDPSTPSPGRITAITVGGLPIDPAGIYSVAANEFVPLFLDAFGIPYTDLHVYSDTSEFQVLSAYVAGIDTLRPLREGRIVCGIVSSVRGSEELPVEFRLDQNYPNPFNGETRIGYRVSPAPARPSVEAGGRTTQSGGGPGEVEWVTLKIYNILGQEVKTLVDEEQKTGNWSVVWNSTDAAGVPVGSGMYIYELHVGDFAQARKMALVR
jgi:5'-nucleotidase / UDP-sugar diphosphatase